MALDHWETGCTMPQQHVPTHVPREPNSPQEDSLNYCLLKNPLQSTIPYITLRRKNIGAFWWFFSNS